MPRRNTRERRAEFSVFHVYNREKRRSAMFIDDDDRRMFMWSILRYLDVVTHHDVRGRPYRSLREEVQLVSFALMLNHFHLVVRQLRAGGMERLMNGAMTTYVRYFHKRHGGEGAMFDAQYRADEKLERRSQLNAIAYVHDNHGLDCRCEFCSHRFFDDSNAEIPGWLAAESGLRMFDGRDNYRDYRRHRRGLDAIAP